MIRMGGGNDGVELNNVYVPRDLTIDTGDGLDRVSLGSVIWAGGTGHGSLCGMAACREAVPGAMIIDPTMCRPIPWARSYPHFTRR